MFELIDKLSGLLPQYLLVFLRLSAMVLVMPILGYASVSARLRVMLALALTLLIAPAISHNPIGESHSLLGIVVIALREVTIGLIIGFGAKMIFEGFSIAGSFIGLQMGLGIMNVIDPGSEQQHPFISQFWLLVLVILFLITNSHHFLITTLYHNFSMIGLGAGSFTPAAGRTLVSGGSLMFEMALKFAAPAMVFLLLVDVALAFVARVMPQMNIFFLSLPLKIGAGIMVLIFSLKISQMMFSYIFDQLESFVYTVIMNLRA